MMNGNSLIRVARLLFSESSTRQSMKISLDQEEIAYKLIGMLLTLACLRFASLDIIDSH